ncbi:pyrroline-5-carboxylate reductase [Variovorax paradoxus]|jgi:pyrroline-5-carboxylate reductase|uniref:pyrroline-5-carboxylate reductase n=1 Tax=Variovorax paradoxus TaxID=34073 RepID=UPI003399D757
MHTLIIFIGGGHMATAMVRGLLAGRWPATDISIVEPNEAQAAHLRQSLGVHVLQQLPDEPVGPHAVVLWAVKPQVLRGVVGGAAGRLKAALHISIAAGVNTASLCAWLESTRVVRAMPNTAAIVNSGVTGLFAAAAEVTASDRTLVERIVGGIGAFFWVSGDEAMDAVTAVSGSGPAYVFHFLEGLQAAAVQLGFEPAQAKRMALLTAEGAVRQALESDEALNVLRERVTSKGGTTAAALAIFDQHDAQGTTVAAALAAFQRAQQLAGSGGNQSSCAYPELGASVLLAGGKPQVHQPEARGQLRL